MWFGKWFWGMLLQLCLLPAVVLADSYRIGPGDVLSLRVLEWQPLENRAQEWEAMRAELRVDSDGMVSVPFLGPVKADTLTPADLSVLIADGLQQRLAISASLDAIVQVATYRPVYVSGAVRTPGEFQFRPGLTAAQLVAQAGGGALGQGAGAIDPRDILSREGTMRLLNLEGERLAIRRAMLQAAIEGLDTLVVPPRQGGASWPLGLVTSENEVLRLRKERRTRELAALDNQIVLLNNEIESLTGRSEALESLIESARRENENAQSLAERGLAATARVSETERTVALVEAQLLDVSTAILRARQGITLAESEKLALRDRELIADMQELQRVEEELERVLATLDTQQGLAIAETGLVLRGGMAEEDTALPEPVVTILRGQGEDAVRLSGLETLLAPGDVVTVAMPRNWGRWFDDQRGIANQ
ncbi:polysaccharide biosynthesis/export family protein [Tabrizicola sp.]|uniref:polysaccharide biosynthesis/export family protein n=1 Tax=Tabrizicola sp. TaxID=2005166 RepID=UPI002633737E|nr:polysaccharide biosynthesis/export family protein [Tabrizicola sp.]MDM7932741.1 polysaccharide biosynthesis/export family protein [Tabrizicola sp.]